MTIAPPASTARTSGAGRAIVSRIPAREAGSHRDRDRDDAREERQRDQWPPLDARSPPLSHRS